MKFVLLILTTIICLYALQYRIELVFKYRNLAFHEIRKAALNDMHKAKVMTRYYDLYKVQHQLLSLNKWTYEDMFPDFNQKISRIMNRGN